MKSMIFYHPYELADNPSKGSEIRPKKMKEAFENLGFRVRLVTGNSLKRKKAIKQIKQEIKQGEKFTFLYGESLNMPVPFTDSHHIPVRPLLDYSFFKMLNRNRVPIGIFYRDVYWRDKEVSRKILFIKKEVKQLMHWLEWFGIKKTVDHLFLPTTGMAKYLPKGWHEKHLSALYPGCELRSVSNNYTKEKSNRDKLILFYVGGVRKPYYDLRPMIRMISEITNVKLILCCREKEWNESSNDYKDLDFTNVEIVHGNSTQIGSYYEKADVVLDVRAPIGYLKNTIPIKIIEAIGYGVPVLVLKGTEYARFVKNEDTGWVANSMGDAKLFLEKIRDDRTLILEKTKKVKKAKSRNCWEARAQKATEILRKA